MTDGFDCVSAGSVLGSGTGQWAGHRQGSAVARWASAGLLLARGECLLKPLAATLGKNPSGHY